MNRLIQFRTNLPLLIAPVLMCFGLLPPLHAVTPAPDGGYLGANTAEGDGALSSLLINPVIGVGNTAIGFDAQFSNSTNSYNTATGAFALQLNQSDDNTANGAFALFQNASGSANTAIGFAALVSNAAGNLDTAVGFEALFSNSPESGGSGSGNTAIGAEALFSNTDGSGNTADGTIALLSNTTGGNNTANGGDALVFNTTGNNNTATGGGALLSNTTGNNNTASGTLALTSNQTGNLNIALGFFAGQNLTTGDNNIDIGNPGVAAEANTIRIGNVVAFTDLFGVVHPAQTATFIAGVSGTGVSGVAVKINSSGQLGVPPSSERFKDEIKPMDKTSEVLLALKPVTFRYKKEIDPDRTPQFGLVAEQVEKLNRDLVVRDANGKPFTVRYDAVNAMLLNEFIKEHRAVQELRSTAAKQEATIAQLKSTVAQQQMGMDALAATVKEQASQIQKVSALLEVSKPAPQVVNNR